MKLLRCHLLRNPREIGVLLKMKMMMKEKALISSEKKKEKMRILG